jgi:hypothetical protein
VLTYVRDTLRAASAKLIEPEQLLHFHKEMTQFIGENA